MIPKPNDTLFKDKRIRARNQDISSPHVPKFLHQTSYTSPSIGYCKKCKFLGLKSQKTSQQAELNIYISTYLPIPL